MWLRRSISAFVIASATCVGCGNSGDSTGSGGVTATSSTTTSTGTGGAHAGGAAASGGGGASNTGGAGGQGGAIDKAAACATDFNGNFTPPFGRLDGQLFAVLGPNDQQCDYVNHTHVVLEVRAAGATFRIDVNVQSDEGPPDVYFLEKQAPLPAPAWSEGWHVNATLDYPTTLGVHASDFKTVDITTLSNEVIASVELGVPISVYCITDGGSAAHEVHKNDGSNQDGAIVLNPQSSSPKFLLFHFDEQMF